MTQLPLDLGYRPALDRDAFLIAPANAEAVAWIDRWPDWPAPALVLEGPAGAGKSHLANVWQKRAGAGLIAGTGVVATAVARLAEGADALVVDGADTAPEEPLLHLYNAMAEKRGHLLLTAHSPPARWPLRLADLASRLKALPVAPIGAPDDYLIRAVLAKHFHDRQLAVTADVVEFLAARIERSFASAGLVVGLIDRAALARRRRVTVPLAREVLLSLESA